MTVKEQRRGGRAGKTAVEFTGQALSWRRQEAWPTQPHGSHLRGCGPGLLSLSSETFLPSQTGVLHPGSRADALSKGKDKHSELLKITKITKLLKMWFSPYHL